MGSTSIKKRSYGDGPKGGASKGQRPTKKQRKAAAYHSSSEEEEEDAESDDDNDKGAPLPAGLFDSDDDIENMAADDGASSEEEQGDDSDSSDDEAAKSSKNKKLTKQDSKLKKPKKDDAKKFKARDAPESSSSEAEDGDSNQGQDSDVEMGSDEEEDDDPLKPTRPSTKSKRNDPDAFATSISKMLSSKLPTSKRADPIVARSAESAAAARQVVDAALEAKARKRLREQKKLAMEKGRIRDVLMPTTTRTLNIATGEVEEKVDDEAENTAQIIATEKRLKKVATRGVVKLFNAVRAAQVKAAEAQRLAREEGIVGSKRREEKVTEMSRQGFLDLIASGGGGLKKGGLEEA
ncbi:Rrp15p domain containing protein [Naviculisporaceae sp. PSN 640]